jgi:hypothetical protein
LATCGDLLILGSAFFLSAFLTLAAGVSGFSGTRALRFDHGTLGALCAASWPVVSSLLSLVAQCFGWSILIACCASAASSSFTHFFAVVWTGLWGEGAEDRMASLGDLLAAENISLLTSFISKSISNGTDAIDGIGHFLHTGNN